MTFAQTAQQEAMKREERLTTLLEDAIGAHAQHGNAEPVHSDNQTVSDSSDLWCQSKLLPNVAPTPHLNSSVSLKEFDSWHHKFEGYVIARMSSLSRTEQRSALAAVLDDDWTTLCVMDLQWMMMRT